VRATSASHTAASGCGLTDISTSLTIRLLVTGKLDGFVPPGGWAAYFKPGEPATRPPGRR